MTDFIGIELWIPITVAAAFFQNLRSALQKHLKGTLSDTGAAYSRFVFALPVIAIYVALLVWLGGYTLPAINPTFLLYCAVGGICQIMFTVFLLWMFSFKSFAVGTIYSKLEVVMVAILGALVLGDTLSGWAVFAIALSALGILALGIGQQNLSISALVSGFKSRVTFLGLICAAWLGGSVVFFRGAALSLEHNVVVMAAAYALFVSLIIQTVLMSTYLAVREKGEVVRVFKQWRWAGAAGVAGALASIAWFTAFTLQNASYVRAVGQIELLFTFLATLFIFRERVSYMEICGIFLIVGAITLLLING
ncbi:MAG: hypothetical protein AAF434_06685 [Pseudomonadota bacterium]